MNKRFFKEAYMKRFSLQAKDGLNISICCWDEVKNAKAVIQIAHGMAEHIARYNDYALYLNSNGYIVIGDDHRGHGYTCGADNKGRTVGDSYSDTLDDMAMLTQYARDTYKLPVMLIGHSYGSFLSQGYIQKYGNLIEACILSASAYMHTFIVFAGKTIAGIQKAFLGENKDAKLIAKLSFGAYDKHFKKENLKNAWISRSKENIEAYEQDPFCGHPMCIGFQASFLKNIYKHSTKKAMMNVPNDLPILMIAGENDPVGGYGKLSRKLNDVYNSLGKKCSIIMYKDDRHEILNEVDKDVVYNDTLEFFDKIISR